MRFLIRQNHSIIQSFALHLLPGLLILISYALLTPIVIRLGGFPQLAMVFSFLLIGVMLNLFFLFFLGRRMNGKPTLKGIVTYNQKTSLRLRIAIIIGFSLYVFPMANLLEPISDQLSHSFASFLPGWFMHPYNYRAFNVTPGIVAFTLIAWLIIDGFLHPIVEELYFRGYLLPRLSHLGWWAPLINAAFFSLFHLWQPHNIPSIFITVLPWFYLIHWKKDVRLSIIIHVLGNTLGATVALINYFT